VPSNIKHDHVKHEEDGDADHGIVTVIADQVPPVRVHLQYFQHDDVQDKEDRDEDLH
jgi:hypothetical protein